jgi:hypothetical protein
MNVDVGAVLSSKDFCIIHEIGLFVQRDSGMRCANAQEWVTQGGDPHFMLPAGKDSHGFVARFRRGKALRGVISLIARMEFSDITFHRPVTFSECLLLA